MEKILYIILFAAFLLPSCNSGELPDNSTDNGKIEISFTLPGFIVQSAASGRTTGGYDLRATHPGSEAERKIDNLCLFLFNEWGENPLTYYFDPHHGYYPSDAEWFPNDGNGIITLDIPTSEAGNRLVYLIANFDEIRNQLNFIHSVFQLENLLRYSVYPWSEYLTTPIPMSGSRLHDFRSEHQLTLPLERAVAKLQLNITLARVHQSDPVVNGEVQYKYHLLEFERNTYVVKTGPKQADLASSDDWVEWDANGTLTGYTTDNGGKVTRLTLATYLNERDGSGTAVEIRLPYNGVGPLPPPEFGDVTVKLLLPDEIKRNHWYAYDLEIETDGDNEIK